MIWFWVRLGLLVGLVGAVAIGAWETDNWRWEAKQKSAIAEAVKESNAEAQKQAAAAASFEKQKGALDVKYQKLAKLLKAHPGAGVCLSNDGVRIVNAALSRSAADPTGFTPAVPGIGTAH
jgi:hypothetical protein